MTSPAPIALFAFNRPQHLSQVLAALSANELASESDLTIFCDAPRNEAEKTATDAVREVAARASGFATISRVLRETNHGCRRSLIDGQREMFERHDRLVVIEDDILCSPYTLSFLNRCLEKYADQPVVFSIAAWAPPPHLFVLSEDYPYDAYFTPRFHCWGWASWRDRWRRVDWDVADYAEFSRQPYLQQAYAQGGPDMIPILDAQMAGKLDTWDIQMDYARFKHGGLGLNPRYSYTTNIGMGSGTHTTSTTTIFDNDLGLALANPRLPDHVFLDSSTVAGRRDINKHSFRQRLADGIARISGGFGGKKSLL